MAPDKSNEEVPRQRILEERPASLSQPLPREKLNKDLQKIVDKEDDLWDNLYDGQYESLLLSSFDGHLLVCPTSEPQIPRIQNTDMLPMQTGYEL